MSEKCEDLKMSEFIHLLINVKIYLELEMSYSEEVTIKICLISISDLIFQSIFLPGKIL